MKKNLRILSLVLLSLFIFSPDTASNGFTEINVTTTNDEIDGDCSTLTLGDLGSDISLREAVCVANNHIGLDTINLPGGTYTLDIGGPGEDSNLEGDLDITDDLVIVGTGNVTVENGIGNPGVMGDGDRIFHIIELPVMMMQTTLVMSDGVDFKIDNITVTSGDVGCTGLGCQTGAGAIDMESTGNLEIFNSHVDGNQTSCQGNCCGAILGGTNVLSVGGIKAMEGGDVIIKNSSVNENTSMCTVTGDPVCFPGDGEAGFDPAADDVNNQFPNCNAGAAALIMGDGTFTLQDSEISENTAMCTGTQCQADSVVTVHAVNFGIFGGTNLNDINLIDSEIKNNLARCEGDNCNADEVFESDSQGVKNLDGAAVENNEASCEGFNCDADEILSLGGFGHILTMIDSSVSNNIAKCDGFDCDSDEVFESDSANQVTVTDSRVDGNSVECTGVSCDTDEICSIFGSSGMNPVHSYTNFSVSFNTSYCNGFDCDTDETFEVDGDSNNVSKTFTNVSVIGNRLECTGDFCDVDEVFSTRGGGRTVADTTISDNMNICTGLGCDNEEIFEIGGSLGPDTVENLRVTNNLVQCIGDNCYGAPAILIQNGIAEVNINNSIISGNRNIFDDEGFQGLGYGAGISNIRQGTVNISNTIISNNRTNGDGAGVFNGQGLTGTRENQGFNPFQDNPNDIMPVPNNGFTSAGGTINLEKSAVFGNIADANNNGSGKGGGIFEGGGIASCTTNTLNSTISGNSAYDGGGIYVDTNSTVNISSSTITDNDSMTTGGGIGLTTGANAVVKNSIVANQASGNDCRIDAMATLISQDHNLESGDSCGFTHSNDQQFTNPMLEPLQFNGGASPTHALLVGSPAIDAVANGSCTDIDTNPVNEDQREFPRPFDIDFSMPPLCDIGAYEFQSFVNITKATSISFQSDEFDFTGSGFPGFCSELDGIFSLSDQKSASCAQLGPGSYTVSESVPQGFELEIECDVANLSGNTSVTIGSDSVDITFGEARDSVSCIFENISMQNDPPTSPQQPNIQINPGDGNVLASISFNNIEGGGTLLVDLPAGVLPLFVELLPNVGTCEVDEFGTVSKVNPEDAEIVCEISDFPENLDLLTGFCKTLDRTGILEAEIEVIADDIPETEFSDFIEIVLDAIEMCDSAGEPEDPEGSGDMETGTDGGSEGCSIAQSGSKSSGLPLFLIVPLILILRNAIRKKFIQGR